MKGLSLQTLKVSVSFYRKCKSNDFIFYFCPLPEFENKVIVAFKKKKVMVAFKKPTIVWLYKFLQMLIFQHDNYYLPQILFLNKKQFYKFN